MKRLFVVAAVLLFGGCQPIPPTIGKEYTIKVAIDGKESTFVLVTTASQEAVNQNVGQCIEYVRLSGLDALSPCMLQRGMVIRNTNPMR